MGLWLACSLLVVACAHNGYQHAQHHANQQGDDCDENGNAQALEILHPPVALKPGPVKVHISGLPEAGVLQGGELLIQLGKIHLPTPLSLGIP